MAVQIADPQTQATTTPQGRYRTGSVISQDGTTIGYRQLGHGPGVVLLHGAMESAQSHMELAEALADRFTVTLPDRRGRGMSGPYGRDYTIQRAVEDVAAVLAETDAHAVFGVSAGGLIMLQAALTLPAIHKAALFEPAMVVNNAVSMAFLARYDQEIAQGKTAAALVTAMKGAQMGPPIFNRIPRWLLERLTQMGMASEEKKATGDAVTMRALAPTLHCDFHMILEMQDALPRFKAVQAEVLLLGGSESPAYLKAALDALETVLPHVRRVEFPGLGHGASGNTDQHGQPERVAQELRRFFA
jgi:pimeloyl-ACP methyl ester carboxylesterase